MAVIMVFLFLLFAYIGKRLEKTWCNFLTIFTGMWALIVGLSSFRLYDMSAISRKACFIVFFGVVSFTVGYLIYYKYPFRLKIRKDVVDIKSTYCPRDKIFKALIIITFIVWAVLAFKTFQELRSGTTYEHIRDIYGSVSEDSSLFQNKYIQVIVHSFFVPCVFVIAAKVLYSLFSEHYHWMYYLLSFLTVVLYCFTTGSRQILLNIIFEIIILVSLSKRKNRLLHISSKTKRRIFLLIVFIASGITIITVFRPGNAADVVWTTQMTIYAYISLPMPMLTYWTDVIDLMGVRTYGYTFVKGGLSLLSRFKLPFPSSYYTASENIAFYSDAYVPMFGSKVYNAFDSVFFYFYLDFGWFGVVLLSFLFGMICVAVYHKVKTNRNEFSVMFLLLFSIAVIKCFARWEFIKEDYVISFIILRLLYKQTKYVAEGSEQRG